MVFVIVGGAPEDGVSRGTVEVHPEEDVQPPNSVKMVVRIEKRVPLIDVPGTLSDTHVAPVFARTVGAKIFVSFQVKGGTNLPVVSVGIQVIRTVRMDIVNGGIPVTVGTLNNRIVGIGIFLGVVLVVRGEGTFFRVVKPLIRMLFVGRVVLLTDKVIYKEDY